MTAPHVDALSVAAQVFGLVAYLAAGIGLGVLHFRMLWWNVLQMVNGGSALASLTAALARFALLGGALVLTSREGAMPLLALASGVLIARSLVTRPMRKAAR